MCAARRVRLRRVLRAPAALAFLAGASLALAAATGRAAEDFINLSREGRATWIF